MKTIVLFHRLELTDFFSALSFKLKGRVNIVHLAYSDDEQKKLLDLGVEGEIFNFKASIRDIWLKNPGLDKKIIDNMDKDIIQFTDGAFNLNSAIHSDRGFVCLDNNEVLRLSMVCLLYTSPSPRD